MIQGTGNSPDQICHSGISTGHTLPNPEHAHHHLTQMTPCSTAGVQDARLHAGGHRVIVTDDHHAGPRYEHTICSFHGLYVQA